MQKGLWKRLKFYLLGVILGTIMVALMFQNRACTWTPTNRIKKAISQKVIVFPDNQIQALEKIGINKENIFKYVVKADINFDASLKEIGTYPRVYVFEKDGDPNKRVQFSLYEDSYITTVRALGQKGQPKRIDHPKGWGEFVRIPRDSAIVFIDKSNYTQCKARGLVTQHPDSLIKQMERTGRINFSKSNLMLTKAEQFITFKQDTMTVRAKTIWYKSRITFKDFIWDKKLPCESDSL